MYYKYLQNLIRAWPAFQNLMPNECKTLIRYNSLIVLFKYTSKNKRSSFEIILCLLFIYQQSMRVSYKYAVNGSFGVYFVSTCLSLYIF